MSATPRIVVVGSVNLDIVASVPRLPVAGETVTGATLARYAGGKGANQALAARRLGASVALVACTGDDEAAGEALALLRQDGVDLSHARVDATAPTGTALIAVAPDGENHIIVAPGANRCLTPDRLSLPDGDALICQLEVPIDAVEAAAARFDGLFCVNLAPYAPVPDAVLARADVIVMNETETAAAGRSVEACRGLIVTTFGADGAELRRAGSVVARARPPATVAVDTTGAGDTFTAALVVALLEKMLPADALDFACRAAALATTRPGAQPSLPWRRELR